jgi:hypothetical protein
MKEPDFAELFAHSRAYQELQPLRVPGGWAVELNELSVWMEAGAPAGKVGGSTLFLATNTVRRFNIDVAFVPEFDPQGLFRLVVRYQPWPRTERGRRRKDLPFAFDENLRTVHEFETKSCTALVAELERWIARCTVSVPEGN